VPAIVNAIDPKAKPAAISMTIITAVSAITASACAHAAWAAEIDMLMAPLVRSPYASSTQGICRI
jgi:hypothetical protein